MERVLGFFGRRPDQNPDFDADAMEWRPTTPPAPRSLAPHYYEGYMPGGWPEKPNPEDIPNTRVRRLPPDPEWAQRDAKRICHGLNLAANAAGRQAKVAGTAAGKYAAKEAHRAGRATLRGGAVAATQVATATANTTTSIVRRFQGENPRDIARRAAMQAREREERRIAAYEVAKKKADEIARSLREEPCDPSEKVWGMHYDENGEFVQFNTTLKYRAPKDGAIFPADQPELQLQRELDAAVPATFRYPADPATNQLYTSKTLPTKKHTLAEMAAIDEYHRKYTAVVFKKKRYNISTQMRALAGIDHQVAEQKHEEYIAREKQNEDQLSDFGSDTDSDPEENRIAPATPDASDSQISNEDASGYSTLEPEKISPRLGMKLAMLRGSKPEFNSFDERRMKLAHRKVTRNKKFGANNNQRARKDLSTLISFDFDHEDKGTQTDPVDGNSTNYAQHEAFWDNLEITEVDTHQTLPKTTERATQIIRPPHISTTSKYHAHQQESVVRSPQNIPTPLASPIKEKPPKIQARDFGTSPTKEQPSNIQARDFGTSPIKEQPPKIQARGFGNSSPIRPDLYTDQATQDEAHHTGPSSSKPETLTRLTIPESTSAKPEEPKSPASDVSSDISSTCDFSPLPEIKISPVLPADDAVGSPSSPSHKAAQKAPSPRISSSVGVQSPPGAWNDEETTVGKEEEKKDFKTPDRRNVSITIREISDKKEAKETPDRKPIETESPFKSGTHGKNRGGMAKKIADRQAEAKKHQTSYTITPLSDEWDARVEDLLTTGIEGLTPYDLKRCAPPKNAPANHDNWLNDEVINKYLKLVSEYGNHLTGRAYEKTPSHHAFNSFFYSKLADKKQGVKSISRWVNKARIAGARLLETERVFVPINAGLHWTLAVVSGTQKTITYYDSLGGSGRGHLEVLLGWVEEELGGAFVSGEWKLATGGSSRQANSDDCGVFTITNARSLTLGFDPEEAFGAGLALVQRRRIVAELANGALLVAGA